MHWGFALLTVKLEWTVSDIISKDSAPFYEPFALKIDLFATAILGNNKTMPPIFDVLFSLRINEGNVKLGPKMCNLEVQLGVTFE